MNGREKIEAAFTPQGSPEIAAVICYESIYIRDRWDDLTRYPWWYRHVTDVPRQLAWRREVIGKLGQDWMELPASPSRATRERLDIVEEEGLTFRVDRLTGEKRRLRRDGVGGWSAPRGQTESQRSVFPDSREQIDRMFPIAAAPDPAEIAPSGEDDLARAMLREFGGEVFPIAHVLAPLWHTYGQWGFEGMMVTVANRPELVEYACERLLSYSLQRVRTAAALGAAGIWIEDCMTDMISPEAFARLNLPYVRQLVEAIRALGMRSIHYFCGNPAGKRGLLLETGADALSLEEGKKGFIIDIDDVVDRTQGRTAVLGNLDAVRLLETGSEDELRAEIGRQIAAGRRNGSRFIMSLGSPATPGTTPERVRRYCDLTHDLGRR
jgi:hypothetical protein